MLFHGFCFIFRSILPEVFLELAVLKVLGIPGQTSQLEFDICQLRVIQSTNILTLNFMMDVFMGLSCREILRMVIFQKI